MQRGAEQPEGVGPSSPTGGTAERRVLVAEDDPQLARQVTSHLKRSGWGVATASDGESALRRARAERFDVLLLDLRLPLRDGVQVLEALRAHGPLPPVVLLSGYLDVETTLEALRAGAREVLEKPVAPQRLLEILERIAPPAGEPLPAPPSPDAWVGRTVARCRCASRSPRSAATRACLSWSLARRARARSS